MLTVALVATLASCTVTKRHYAPGYHVEWKHFNAKSSAVTHADLNHSALTTNEQDEQTNVWTAPAVEAVASLENNDEQLASTSILESVSISDIKAVSKLNKAIKNEAKSNDKYNEVQQSNSVNAQATKGPDVWSWLIWVAAILCIPVFGGPIFILVWTSSKNGTPEWKPVLISLLLYCLCWLPGLIYDIIWINKNCSGSLFND
ncbi:MAG: hypothetical protein RL106_2 [Bacteroidota bacterium]|jgi:uncharacterized membrane protein YqaE (UPF0057 family)